MLLKLYILPLTERRRLYGDAVLGMRHVVHLLMFGKYHLRGRALLR